MKNKLVLFLFLIICYINSLFATIEKRYLKNFSVEKTITSCESIESFLLNYKRKATILEISSDCEDIMCLGLAKKIPQNIYIILLLKKTPKKLIKEVKTHPCKNIIILEPNLFNCEDIETLGRCEHLDVVIVHKFYEFFDHLWQKSIREFLHLGDYTFILTDWENTPKFACFKDQKIKEVIKTQEGILVLCQTNKQRLDIARFTQRYKPRNLNNNYQVISTFDKKIFNKNSAKKLTNWIPGINLMTFVLLRGIYPTDDIISRSIASLQHSVPYHNDLMIGNMIIQGQKVIPIDFQDERRNASMSQCINHALTIFNGDYSRLKNPALRIKQYYDMSKKST